MNETLKIILSLSLSGSLLILILFLLRPVFKERLSKRWQYYIWLVVIARLLLPFAPEINLIGALFQGIDKGIAQTEFFTPPMQQGGTSVPDVNLPPGNGATDELDSPQSGLQEPKGPADNPAQDILLAIGQNLWLGWLVVVLILFIRKITIYQSFVKYIRGGCVEVAEIDLLDRFGKLVEQNKIKNAVEIYTNKMISSPLLIGFFRPCIVLPTINLSASDFQNTIRHELIHYKRLDMFYKWLVQFSVCVHWFNPLVYLMGREVARTCELSCDEAVIWKIDPQEQRAYGDTLLNAMGAEGNYKDSLASVTLNESKERLKERLDAIMRFKKTTRLTAAISIALVVIVCFGATAAGAYAAPKILNAGTTTPPGKTSDIENKQETVSNVVSSAAEEDEFFDGWDSDWADFDASFSEDDFPSVDLSSVKLINTKQWAVNGITEIEANYVTDDVRLLTSPTDEIILKEYLTEDDPIYYATTSLVDSTLKIEIGERPAPSATGYISIIEIYVPANYSGIVKLSAESGCINIFNYKGKMDCHTKSGIITMSNCMISGSIKSDSGCISIIKNYGILDCSTISGLITVSDSVISGSIKSKRGIVKAGLNNISGDIDIRSESGHVIANISDSATFSIRAEAITGVVKNNFSASLTTSNRFVTGEWGTTPTYKIELYSNSGNVEINKN